MFENLLTNKFHSPPIPPRTILREGLINRLNRAVDSKLTIISAPAGYGKTTLLSMWSKQASIPVIWLSLDEGDNDLTRFLAYVVTAFQRVAPSVGNDALAQLQTPHPQSYEIILTSLLNDLSAHDKPIALFMDDYHLIHTQSVHGAVDYLLEFLPTQIHIIMASRADPPLSLPRLRARDQLTEIRQKNLRFTTEEATSFLNNIMDLDLSMSDVVALESRTEGWIAGLVMAAISLQGYSPSPALRSTFIQSFTGSNRFILDYLIEEVLNRQPPTLQEFLLKTSILERLSGSLCDAVLGKPSMASLENHESQKTSNSHLINSQSILEYLEASNLFIVPLDNERQWYRYHRLFSDLLKKRLCETAPDKLPELHHRASVWYEQQGLMDEAIDHALTVKDFDRAIALIEANVEATLMRSEVTVFLNWMEKLPKEQVHDHPLLDFYHAFASLMSGRSYDVVEQYLRGVSLVKEIPGYTGRIAALQAYISLLKADLLGTAKLCQKALEYLPERDSFLRSTVSWILSLTQLDEGIQDAQQALKEVIRIGQNIGSPLISVASLCFQAKLHSRQGDLESAQEMLEKALKMAVDNKGQRLPIASEALIGLGDLERERNRLEVAADLIIEGIELSKQWSEVAAFDAYLPLARIRLAQGDLKGAREAQETAQKIAHGSDASIVDNLIANIQLVYFFALQGDRTEAMYWAEKHGLFPEVSSEHRPNCIKESDYIRTRLEKYRRLVLARLLILQGRTSEAVDLLDILLTQVKQLGRIDLTIECQILIALALQEEGNNALAVDALADALTLAEPGEHIRIFLDEGEPLFRLLCRVATLDITPIYVTKLLKSFEESNSSGKDKLQPYSPFVDPISDRELDVLRLLANGKSNPEIADELVIAVSTVSTHCKNIYSKMNVHKRWEAVKLAQKLGLL